MSGSYHERILRVMVYVQDHLDDELSLDHLAGVACFSPYHFHRIFRGIAGEPVKEYVRRLRLERAAQRLKTSESPVTEIAFDSGYESHEAFTRAFHARFGASPSTWRETNALRDAGLIEARIVRMPARRAAFLRHTGPYDRVGEAWSRLFALAGAARLLGPGMEFFGIVHDDPEITEPERLRYDAALKVRPEFTPVGEFGVQELPEREYAMARHVGPYSTLSDSYARLCGGWLAQSGREPASAPAVEYYRNDPRSTAPEQLVTDIYVPLSSL